MLLSYLIFSLSSTDFSDIFLTDFQPLENVLGLIQNLNQNLVAELAPLGLGDLSGLELAEVDVVLVSHAQRLDDFCETVKHFLNVFFTRSVHFHLATPVVPCCVRRTFRFEDVAEALPELATDVDEVRGVEDLRVHSSVRVEIVVGVVVRIHAARFVFHAQRLDDFFDIVNGFRVFFQIFFLRLRLTTGLESRKKAYKKEKFFYKKSLTT
jgi:hypothetical protein